MDNSEIRERMLELLNQLDAGEIGRRELMMGAAGAVLGAGILTGSDSYASEREIDSDDGRTRLFEMIINHGIEPHPDHGMPKIQLTRKETHPKNDYSDRLAELWGDLQPPQGLDIETPYGQQNKNNLHRQLDRALRIRVHPDRSGTRPSAPSQFFYNDLHDAIRAKMENFADHSVEDVVQLFVNVFGSYSDGTQTVSERLQANHNNVWDSIAAAPYGRRPASGTDGELVEWQRKQSDLRSGITYPSPIPDSKDEQRPETQHSGY